MLVCSSAAYAIQSVYEVQSERSAVYQCCRWSHPTMRMLDKAVGMRNTVSSSGV